MPINHSFLVWGDIWFIYSAEGQCGLPIEVKSMYEGNVWELGMSSPQKIATETLSSNCIL